MGAGREPDHQQLETERRQELASVTSREELDRQKLLLEISELQKPWYRKPTNYAQPLSTLIVGAISAAVLYFSGVFDSRLNRLTAERTSLQTDVSKLALERRDLEAQRSEIDKQIRVAIAEKVSAGEKLRLVLQEKETVQKQLLALRHSSGVLSSKIREQQYALTRAESGLMSTETVAWMRGLRSNEGTQALKQELRRFVGQFDPRQHALIRMAVEQELGESKRYSKDIRIRFYLALADVFGIAVYRERAIAMAAVREPYDSLLGSAVREILSGEFFADEKARIVCAIPTYAVPEKSWGVGFSWFEASAQLGVYSSVGGRNRSQVLERCPEATLAALSYAIRVWKALGFEIRALRENLEKPPIGGDLSVLPFLELLAFGFRP